MDQGLIKSRLNYGLSPRMIACVAGIWAERNKYCLPIPVAAAVIRASGTHALVLHIPNLKRSADPVDEILDFEELLEAIEIPLEKFVLLINTSLCSTLEETREVVKVMRLFCARPPWNRTFAFLKLEILDGNLRPNDELVCEVISGLDPETRKICLPYLVGESDSVERAVALGCPAVRIWCSDIGKGMGITDEERLGHIVESARVPLILEGGLAGPLDVQRALALKFEAVLVNSAFRNSLDPLRLAKDLRTAIDNMANISPHK
jgi:thiazole synthase